MIFTKKSSERIFEILEFNTILNPEERTYVYVYIYMPLMLSTIWSCLLDTITVKYLIEKLIHY